jgi:hypothetical protein
MRSEDVMRTESSLHMGQLRHPCMGRIGVHEHLPEMGEAAKAPVPALERGMARQP